MRCVSYTRTTSCKAYDVPASDIIGQQNERIQMMAKKNGWVITEKYSDRRKSEDAKESFEKLLEDGISRKFDMVIIDSLDRCGESISRAEDVLLKTFYPAGIQFAVAGDEFCTIGKNANEVAAYIKRKRSLLYASNMHDEMKERVRSGLLTVHDEKYGYLLTEDKRNLVIDTEAADIIREIFQLIIDGTSLKNIAIILNERKVESPMAHLSRVGSKGWKQINVGWSQGAVTRIAGSTVYLGYWTKIIDGEEVTLNVPPIFDEEFYKKAQDAIASRRTTKNNYGAKIGILSKKIFDKESGNALYLRNFPEARVFLENPQLRYIPANPNKYLEQEIVLCEVRKAIRKEMKLADYIYEIVCTQRAKEEIEQHKRMCTKEAQTLFEKEAALAEYRIPLYHQFKEGVISKEEYEIRKNQIREMVQMYEERFSEIEERIKIREQVLSVNNPWLKAFAKKQLPEELTRKDVEQWIEKVIVENLRMIEVFCSNNEWKKQIPESWMNEYEGE